MFSGKIAQAVTSVAIVSQVVVSVVLAAVVPAPQAFAEAVGGTCASEIQAIAVERDAGSSPSGPDAAAQRIRAP